MKYILIKGLRFFDYPGGWLFFGKNWTAQNLNF